MLKEITEGVLIHESAFIQSNTVIVRGRTGVLLIDPGITRNEMVAVADDLREMGEVVVAGFSTHPHWDHVLWHDRFGDVPRYATTRCAATMRDLVSDDDWRARVAGALPPELADDIPMELLGLVTGLPGDGTRIPWDGPEVRVVEHRAHTASHAALVIEGHGVLVAGDMLSDILMPFLDLQAADPIADYLDALELLDAVADDIGFVIPGHGSVGEGGELRTRIGQDRAYVRAVREGTDAHDPRVGPSAPLDWVPGVHEWQLQQLSQKTAS